MIELGIAEFFALAVVGIAVLAGLAVALDWLQEWREARAARRHTVRCRICGAASRQKGRQAIQACPGCGSASWAGRDRRLG